MFVLLILDQPDFCQAAFASPDIVGIPQPKDAKSSFAKPMLHLPQLDNASVTQVFIWTVRTVRDLLPARPDPPGIQRNSFVYVLSLGSI
jgi:hypothetical protein